MAYPVWRARTKANLVAPSLLLKTMKLITKETGVSVALLISIVGGAIYFTMFILSIKAEVATVKDESATIKASILEHQVTDKEVFTKLSSESVTKTEVNLGTEVITTKLNAISEKQTSDIKRMEMKLDRVEGKVDLLLTK